MKIMEKFHKPFVVTVAFLLMLSSCRKTKLVSSVEASGDRSTCLAAAVPAGDLAASLANIKPLTIASTKSFATLTPISKNKALTARQALGANPNKADLTSGSAHVTAISTNDSLNLAILTFDRDLFAQGPIPRFYADTLPVGSAVVVAGYRSTQTDMPGTTVQDGNPAGNLQVVDTILGDATAPGGLSELKGAATSAQGPCISEAEYTANTKNNPRAVAGKDYSAGGVTGGPILFLGDDNKAYFVGIVTAQVSTALSASPAVQGTGLRLDGDDQTTSGFANQVLRYLVRYLAVYSSFKPMQQYVSQDVADSYYPTKVGLNRWSADNFFDEMGIIFAPEFEFPTIYYDDVDNYLKQVDSICKSQGEKYTCLREPGTNRYTVTARDSESKIRIFPYKDEAVLEIPLDPMTISQYIKAKPLIQTFIFDATAAINLHPDTTQYNRWLAHMNLSWDKLRQGKDTDPALFIRPLAKMDNAPA